MNDKPKPFDPLAIKTRPDRDRRVQQADRLARVLRLLALIHSGKNYDVKAIAREIGCSTRTVARDLQVLTYAGVPWYFDKETASYRLPLNYRIPIPMNIRESAMSRQSEAVDHYRGFFTVDDPMTLSEIDFVARWIHENHNFSELHKERPWAMQWNARLNLPSVALANFHTIFMAAFRDCPDAFIRTVWQSHVDFLMVPWKSEAAFLARNAAICNWMSPRMPNSIIDVPSQIDKYRSC
ncbi:hypothetical protein Poly24_16410 [Rosistilla carotiformis]|uniref:Uncharacterized protein n=1 Tax=Rosistilla carotiformis TaxID=2528017 RepID=A0A518JQW9_9BACT|nr:HTH domain-containing protein [Rosistilla carotiformis]QDV67935.1 hypothetical protein Poly24_16410 [Rosistilla carotiformis]